MLLKICGEVSNIPYMQGGKNISELEEFRQEEWEKIPKAKMERLLAGYRKRLQAVEEELQSTHWEGSQTFAQGLFPFFIILKLKHFNK